MWGRSSEVSRAAKYNSYGYSTRDHEIYKPHSASSFFAAGDQCFKCRWSETFDGISV